MFSSTTTQQSYTIKGLSREELATGKQPYFAKFTSDGFEELGNSVTGHFISLDHSVRKDDKNGDKLQMILKIKFEDGSVHQIKANMTSITRTIMNKLACEKELGLVKFELWNIKDRETGDQNAQVSVYNNGVKLTEKLLDYNDSKEKGLIKITEKPDGKKESFYHSIAEINRGEWNDTRFDVILFNKFDFIKSLEEEKVDKEEKFITPEGEEPQDGELPF